MLVVRRVQRAQRGLRRLPTSRLAAENGQVLAIFAFGLPIFVLFVALAVNIGAWYASDAGLQKAADAGALAGAQYLANNPGLTAASYPCLGITTATSCAVHVANLNNDAEPVDSPDAVIVTVNGRQGVKVTTRHTGFQGIYFSSDREESATAVASGIGGAVGGMPITFRQDDWPPPGTEKTFVFNDTPAPGAFELLNLGGSGSCSSNGASAVADCIRCTTTYSYPDFTPQPLAAGCPTPTQVCDGTAFGSAPGNKINSSPVQDAFASLYGKIVLIPIYSSASGTGANAVYQIVGFAAFKITNWSNPNLTGTFYGVVAPYSVQGSCAGSGKDFGVTTINLIA